MKDVPVKTLLTEGQYKRLKIVIEARGFTESGYIRHVILNDISATEDLVCQMQRLTGSTETDLKQATKGSGE